MFRSSDIDDVIGGGIGISKVGHVVDGDRLTACAAIPVAGDGKGNPVDDEGRLVWAREGMGKLGLSTQQVSDFTRQALSILT